jgi:hypothetical protein
MTQKQDETFRVIDRRLFTAEGELRQEALEQKREAEKTGATSGPATVAGPATPGRQPALAGPTVEPTTAKPSPNFERLVESLANNAALFLGAVPDPRTGQPILDLEGAREMIDMLDALREKTRGNLAPEEEQLLLDLTGSLKLSFLESSKSAAKGMRERAHGKS